MCVCAVGPELGPQIGWMMTLTTSMDDLAVAKKSPQRPTANAVQHSQCLVPWPTHSPPTPTAAEKRQGKNSKGNGTE